MEKEVVKIIKDLFKPVDESLELLKKMDKKLDLQASSRLSGQLEMLELLASSGKKKQASYEICLGNLYESIEYYKGLTDQTIKEYKDTYANHRIKHFLLNTPKAWAKFGRKSMQKEVLCFARILDYASLWCLSEAAAINCLVKLNYSSQVIEEREHRLYKSWESVVKLIFNRQAATMMVIADFEDGALIKGKLFEYMAGKNALRSLKKGYLTFFKIDSLLADRYKHKKVDMS